MFLCFSPSNSEYLHTLLPCLFYLTCADSKLLLLLSRAGISSSAISALDNFLLISEQKNAQKSKQIQQTELEETYMLSSFADTNTKCGSCSFSKMSLSALMLRALSACGHMRKNISLDLDGRQKNIYTSFFQFPFFDYSLLFLSLWLSLCLYLFLSLSLSLTSSLLFSQTHVWFSSAISFLIKCLFSLYLFFCCFSSICLKQVWAKQADAAAMSTNAILFFRNINRTRALRWTKQSILLFLFSPCLCRFVLMSWFLNFVWF